MNNLILIGMMGCGKTTVGRLLADKLGRELVDTDALIEAREGRRVAEIFARRGEAGFRALELAACRELGRRQDLVISCGGGLPLQPGCMAALKENGAVFWLNRDPGETYDGLDVSGRPLAQQGREAFLERYAQRAPVYRGHADYVITGVKTPAQAASAIAAIAENLEREETTT